MDLKTHIRDFPNFPRPGIMFRDISPLLRSPDAMKYIGDKICEYFGDDKIDLIAGAEARGLIFANLVAADLHKGLIMLRKKGKLPGATHTVEYELEYNTATLEVQKDLIQPGQRVLVVDDLLATGGTSLAAAQLIQVSGGIIVGFAFVVELLQLSGRKVLHDYEVKTLVSYE